jgi:hypothetical protein
MDTNWMSCKERERFAEGLGTEFHPKRNPYLISTRTWTWDEEHGQQDGRDEDDDEARRGHDRCTTLPHLRPGWPPHSHLIAVRSLPLPRPVVGVLHSLFVPDSGPSLHRMVFLLGPVLMRHLISYAHRKTHPLIPGQVNRSAPEKAFCNLWEGQYLMTIIAASKGSSTTLVTSYGLESSGPLESRVKAISYSRPEKAVWRYRCGL